MTELVRLGELTTKIGSGATPRGGKDVYTFEGCNFIRSQNVLDNRMKLDDIAHITEDAADSLRSVEVRPDDVLLNITGDSIARCCKVEVRALPARVNQHVAILRTNDRLDPGYLQRVLVNPSMKEFLLGMSDGGTRRALTKSQIGSLEIPLPPLPEQRAIAEVLGALDDKIAANERVATVLAELADAEFLRFADRATGSAPLADQVSTQYGITTSSDGSGPCLLRVTDINKYPWVDWTGAPRCDVTPDDLAKYGLFEGDILVARMADPGKVAYIDANDPESVFASYLVRLKAPDLPTAMFTYYFLRSTHYQDYVEQNASGTVQKNLNAKKIVNTVMPVISDSEKAEFFAIAKSIRQSVQGVRNESSALARTRDELLPLLMSGKVTVRDLPATASAPTI